MPSPFYAPRSSLSVFMENNETQFVEDAPILKTNNFDQVEIESKLETAFDTLNERASNKKDKLIVDEVMKNATSSFSKLKSVGSEAILTPNELLALEVIVIADGSRPAIRIKEGQLDPEGLPLGAWKNIVEYKTDLILRASEAVGRIELPSFGGQWQMMGTGFMISENLIMTNMHVLRAISSMVYRDDRWEVNLFYPENTRIKFEDKFFKIKPKPVAIGPSPKPYDKSVENLDFAVLEIENVEGFAYPEPLLFSDTEDVVENGEVIFTLGFPARPADGTVDAEVIKRLFDFKFGVLRASPGDVVTSQGDHPADIADHFFTHNCTTLGGNSGSPVLRFSSNPNENNGLIVSGLHFGGIINSESSVNAAHPISIIQDYYSPTIVNNA